MSIRFRSLDPKSRRLVAAGNLSLAIALVLWNFARPAGVASHAWLDAICGLFFGISIGANLTAIRRAGRCRTGAYRPGTS